MSAPAFLVTQPIPEPAMTSLHAAGRVYIPPSPPDTAELASACGSKDFTVVIAQLSDRFDAAMLAEAKVSGIANYAVGYDNIDIAAATAHRIVVSNTPGVLTDATADIAMLLILATARRAVEADRFTRSGQFTGWNPTCSWGATSRAPHLGLPGSGVSPAPPRPVQRRSAWTSRSAPTHQQGASLIGKSLLRCRFRPGKSAGLNSSNAATSSLCMCPWTTTHTTSSTPLCLRP